MIAQRALSGRIGLRWSSNVASAKDAIQKVRDGDEVRPLTLLVTSAISKAHDVVHTNGIHSVNAKCGGKGTFLNM